MPGYPAPRARPPWPQGSSRMSVEPLREAAPQETVAFHCERESCPHTPLPQTFAEGAEVPPAVWCRCGKVARRDGAPPDSQPQTPKYGQVPGGAKDLDAHGISPMAQLLKRRTPEEGERLLAERLAQVRRGGAP